MRDAGKLQLERYALARELRRRQVKPSCNPLPHPAPAKDITIDHVEGLVSGCRCSRCPLQMPGQQTRIGHIGKAIPLNCGTGKEEGPASLTADSCIRGEGYAQFVGVTYRVADNSVRTVHTPGEPVSLRRSEKLILLRVVEIIDVKPGLLFAERRSGQLALAVILEGSKVMLQTCDQ